MKDPEAKAATVPKAAAAPKTAKAAKTAAKSAKAPPDAPKPKMGRPPYPPGMARSGRIIMRTTPEIAAKARRLGTERIEALILAAPE